MQTKALNMKQRLSFLLSFLLSCSVFASSGQISIKGGSWSFTTENIKSNSESSSGVGAYSVELAYGFVPKWLFVFGVNLIMSDVYTGSSGYGFDLGAKYFPLTDSGTVQLDSDYSEVSIQESWRPYVGAFMRQRLFGLALSTSYMGPGVSLGVDYSLSKKWVLSGEFRYDYLYGQGDTLAIQNNILLGFGIEF